MIIAQRFHFHRRDQQPGESVATYLAELRRLAAKCEFTGGHLQQILRDRLVCGLCDQVVQKRLLTEPSLPLDRVLEIAKGMEAAAENARALSRPITAGVAAVARIPPTGTPPVAPPAQTNSTGGSCYRCSRAGHDPHSCGFRGATCHNCGKRGHIRSVCRARRRRAPNVQLVDTQGEQTPPEEPIFQVHTRISRPYQVLLQLNGQPVPMEIDTGAAVSLILVSMWRSLFPDTSLRR